MTVNQWVERVDRDAIVAIASDLIRIPSPSGEEQKIMDFVVEWCTARGLTYEVLSKEPGRPNVIVSIGDETAGPTIAMNGHLDTVPVSDVSAWKTKPFDPVVSEDGARLFGRGACDMKSSTGVILYLMDVLKTAPLRGRLQAHIVCDEETSGAVGTVFLMDEIQAGRLQRPDYCFIGEMSQLKVRNAERGLLAVDITFLGRASHTAAARVTGINAIAKAAKGVLALEQALPQFHPSVGHPVISVNTIQGGVAHNVVPGECTISVDRRLIPGETRESAIADMRAALDAVAVDDPDFKYDMVIDPNGDYIPANITPENSPLVKAFQESVRKITGNEPEFFVAWAGATDGRFYRQLGIDTVGFGTRGENAHGANEAVFIDDLVIEAKVYVETITQLLGVS